MRFLLAFIFLVLFYFGYSTNNEVSTKNNSYAFVAFLQEYLEEKYQKEFDSYLYVSVKQQTMFYIKNGSIVDLFIVSTSKNGTGNTAHSEKTPTGLHAVKSKYGQNTPYCGILESRQFNNEIARINVSNDHLITSRVLWLTGLEKGFNNGNYIDTYSRLIYIHGTPSENRLGVAQSSGCIRMSNSDIIDLFDEIPLGLPIIILNN